MRVIAGRLGGRNFHAPATHRTHPMSERMRGAMFNVLGDIEGLTILDCFGGSGALSIEALSRGAASSVIVEIDKMAHKTIVDNLSKLGLDNDAKAIRANVAGWSKNNQTKTFDLVFCNPPFDGLRAELIRGLARHIHVGGLLVLSWPARDNAPNLPGLDLETVKEKDYGDAQLAFYRRIS